MLTFISLFAGIGGFDLGLERAGMVCKAQVEIDDFANRVLQKHWPDVPRFRDIRNCGRHNLPSANVVAGGFPCQPYSHAGPQKGEFDERNLWPEMLRVVTDVRPRWVIAENVTGIINNYLDTVLTDLENEKYKCDVFVLPAYAFGLPQIRKRTFIVAHANEKRVYPSEIQPKVIKTPRSVQRGQGIWTERIIGANSGRIFAIPNPGILRSFDGIPSGVDRIRLIGNAVVPAIAQFIGEHIIAADELMKAGVASGQRGHAGTDGGLGVARS